MKDTSLSLPRLTSSSLPCLVVTEQDSAAAQQYSRQGCPTGLRAELWALILNSTNQPQVTQTHSWTLVTAVSCHYLLQNSRAHTAAVIPKLNVYCKPRFSAAAVSPVLFSLVSVENPNNTIHFVSRDLHRTVKTNILNTNWPTRST